MKTNNPSLGKTTCNACDDIADIKRKKTGKKLLYLHCKNCGLDQRSGKFLQKKWQFAVDGISETDTETTSEITPIKKPVLTTSEINSESTEIHSKTDSEISTETTEQEWQPATKNNPLLQVENNERIKEQTRPESSTERQASTSNGWWGLLSTAIGIGLVVARIRR